MTLFFASLAQAVERLTRNEQVTSSTLVGGSEEEIREMETGKTRTQNTVSERILITLPDNKRE